MFNKSFFSSKSAVVFSRWSNRPWAVFRSLHKQVHIATLLFCYSLLSLPSQAQVHEQNDSLRYTATVALDEVVVEAQRQPASYVQTARVVSIISKQELLAAGVQTPEDLLRYLPDIDLRQRGRQGVQADVSLRGGTFDQVLILLNGVNISDPQTGHHNLNLVPPMESIERIEILHGPASKVLGPNAFSGAINFITAQGDAKQAKASIQYGEHKLFKSTAAVQLPTGKLQHFVAVSQHSSNGYTANTDFNQQRFLYTASLNTHEYRTQAQLAYSNKAFGANAFYSYRFPDQYEETSSYLASFRIETGKTLKLSSRTYWRRNYDRFLLKRTEPEFYENLHRTDAFGTNLSVSFRSPLGSTAFGVDFRNERIISSSLGIELSEALAVPGHDDKFYTRGFSRQIVSAFAEHNVYLRKFVASAGILASSYTDLPQHTEWAPSLEMAYFLTDRVKLYALSNTAMRMPTFTDLYYVSPGNVGNPNLKPERATTYEAGFKYQSHILRGSLSFFYRDGRQIIDWSRATATDPWQTSNFNLSTQGISASAFIDFQQWFAPAKSPLQYLRISYSYLSQSREETDLLSRYAMDYLRHKLVLGTAISLPWHFSLNLQTAYNQRNGSYIDTEGTSLNYNGFWLVDARLAWRHRGAEAYIEASNLFDKRYYDIDYVYQPGRWISGGLKFELNWK